MMPCPDRSVWAAQAADAADDDDPARASALRTHLDACAPCRAVLAQCEAEERGFAARLRAGEPTVPPATSARIARALAARLALAARGVVDAPAADPRPTPFHTPGGAMSTALTSPASLAEPARTNGTAAVGSTRSSGRPDLRSGTTYAELTVEERLERDALADAYIARGGSGDPAVDLVVLDPTITRDPAIRGALVDGMRALARVDHPHVQRLRSFGKSKGCYYAAFAYVPGEPASEKLRGRKPQDYAATVAHLRQLASGLAALHAAGVAHGRIGPRTVLLAPDRATLARPGLPLVLELERAAWTRLMPVYLAPEVLAGQPCDARADVFALGCLAYHLLAGTAPYRSDSMDEAAHRIAAGAPGLRKHNQRVPAEAADAIARMIAPDPAQRFADAAELGRVLAALPREVSTHVAMDYASALGAAALAEPTAAPTAPSPERTGATSGRTTSRSRPANYRELVASMNEAATGDLARERDASSTRTRTSLADLAGQSYRRLASRATGGVPARVVGLAASVLVCVALGSGAFYASSVQHQDRLNMEITSGPRPGIQEGAQIDPNSGKAPPPTADEIRARLADDCQTVYSRVLDELRKLEIWDPKTSRERLDRLSRMLLEGCIDKGKKKGFEWTYLADAYNLRARIEFYWVYTDRFFEISDSVRKDHIGIAHRDLQTALRLYALPGAQTQFRLRTHSWMPEHRESARFALDAHKQGVASGYAEVRAPTALHARDDLAHFLRAAGLPVRQQ